MEIRRFRDEDAENVSALVLRTLRTVNIKDYTQEYIERIAVAMQPERIRGRAQRTHFYVAEENDQILGCGAIGPYWGSMEESSFFTVFVAPEMEGKGIGRRIIETLEQDEYALRAKRIEVPASITGAPFYLKMGYTFKNNVQMPDEEGLLRMEKFR